jgi:hypothetical protein
MNDSHTRSRPHYGVVLLIVGVVLRLTARKIAWPSNVSYSGLRSETQWARMEDAYAEVAIVLMCLGGVLIAIHYARHQFGTDRRKQPAADQDR